MNEQTSPASLLDALMAKWRAEQAGYPSTSEGLHAAAAVRLCAKELEALRPSLLTPREKEKDIMTYYGPHNCEHCGATIVKASREEGGKSFDPPPLLLRVFQRGSEAGNPDVAYPMAWTPHVCDGDAR